MKSVLKIGWWLVVYIRLYGAVLFDMSTYLNIFQDLNMTRYFNNESRGYSEKSDMEVEDRFSHLMSNELQQMDGQIFPTDV